jgi:hypothetical protein
VTDPALVVAQDLHRLAWLQVPQWCGGGIDLVAVDPAVAREQAALLILAQEQGAGLHGWDTLKWSLTEA